MTVSVQSHQGKGNQAESCPPKLLVWPKEAGGMADFLARFSRSIGPGCFHLYKDLDTLRRSKWQAVLLPAAYPGKASSQDLT